jgi:hypothetical protein
MSSFGFIKVFLERKGERYRTEYSEGTVGARWWFGVLGGYFRGKEVVMFD